MAKYKYQGVKSTPGNGVVTTSVELLVPFATSQRPYFRHTPCEREERICIPKEFPCCVHTSLNENNCTGKCPNRSVKAYAVFTDVYRVGRILGTRYTWCTRSAAHLLAKVFYKQVDINMFIFLRILLAIKNRGMCFLLFNEVDQTRRKSVHTQGGESMRVAAGRGGRTTHTHYGGTIVHYDQCNWEYSRSDSDCSFLLKVGQKGFTSQNKVFYAKRSQW